MRPYLDASVHCACVSVCLCSREFVCVLVFCLLLLKMAIPLVLPHLLDVLLHCGANGQKKWQTKTRKFIYNIYGIHNIFNNVVSFASAEQPLIFNQLRLFFKFPPEFF